MDSRIDRMKIDDRLSGLQDDLLLKILSFVSFKDAIKTSVLSSRWRFLWTSVPHLDFSSDDFPTMDMFYAFVMSVLSRRDNQLHLSSFKLYLRGIDGHDVAQRIVNHAFSLNVQQVNITCFCGDNKYCLWKENPGFPLYLLSSHTLKHLTLRGSFRYDHITLTSAGTGELSSLTTLNLQSITLYDGFFSKCPNLENLTLSSCEMTGSEVLRVSHPRLSNLTLENGGVSTINVVTPQLKNLTISEYRAGYRILAPELASLLIRGHCPSMFSTDGFPSLEKAQLSLHSLGAISNSDASTIISLLREFHNVKVLSLSMEIIKHLNSSVELLAHQPFPLANLKSLQILPKMLCMWEHQHMRVNMSTEVKNCLLNGSPKATLTEVLREKCCDIAASAAPGSI